MKFNKVALSIACAAGFTVAGAAAANADTVTVKSGDTLSQIADENNTTVSSIQSLNSLQNIHLIFPGQKLVINANNGDAAVSTQQSAQTTQQASQQQTMQQASQQQTTQQASQQQTMQHSKQLLHQANRLRAIGSLHANQAAHILLKTATIMASISFQAHTWAATILLKTKNALPTATCVTAMVHGQMPSRTGCKTVGTKKRRLMNKTAESN